MPLDAATKGPERDPAPTPATAEPTPREERQASGARRVAFRLVRGADGRLSIVNARGEAPVELTRCFPWSAPGHSLSLRDTSGEERAFILDPDELDPASRAALDETIEHAGFVLDVVGIVAVDEDFELRTWQVETNRGFRRFQTPLDAWPRKVGEHTLVLEDVYGDLYRIRDPARLDTRSRALLFAFED